MMMNISIAISAAISERVKPFAIQMPYCFFFNKALVVNTATTELIAIIEIKIASIICRIVTVAVSD